MPGLLLNYALLAAVLLVAGALVCVSTVVLAARSLLRPPRMTDGKALYLMKRISPTDLGLSFEDVSFTVRDERAGGTLRIAGWWIPMLEADGRATGDRCVVLLHGYADAKVGAIAWAPVWRDLGFHVLAIDLRAHGESDGKHSTAGDFERHDVAQVIHQLRAERPGQTRHVVLFGVSLGAAVAAATAALRTEDEPGDVPAVDVAAVVLESPFADFRHAAAQAMRWHGLPGGWMPAGGIALAQRLSGADFDAVRTVDGIGRVPCPLMLITSGDDDACLAQGDAERLDAAVRSRPVEYGPNLCWKAAGAGHLMAVVAEPEEYARQLGVFVDAAVARDGCQVTADAKSTQLDRL